MPLFHLFISIASSDKGSPHDQSMEDVMAAGRSKKSDRYTYIICGSKDGQLKPKFSLPLHFEHRLAGRTSFKMLSEDYEQQDICVLLNGIQVKGLRQRTRDRPTDAFVTVSVDGQQQLVTQSIHASLEPQWNYNEPFKLSVYPSSSIKFTVYRRRASRDVFGDKYLGEVEVPLLAFVNEPESYHTLDTKLCITHETGSLKATLHIDTSGTGSRNDSLLDGAVEKLKNAAQNHKSRSRRSTAETAGIVLLHAIGSLDRLVSAVDGIADIHPLCKVAWTLLSSVHKAIKHQQEQDSTVRGLVTELRNTLAHVRECRDLKTIPGATDVIRDLALLIAQGATLIDDYMKHKTAVRILRSAISHSLEHRIQDCQTELRALGVQLQTTLIIRIYQNAEQINERQERASSSQSEHPAQKVHGASHHAGPGVTGPATARSLVSDKSHAQVNHHPNGSNGRSMPHTRQERPFPAPMPYPHTTPISIAPLEKPQRKMDHPMPSPSPSPSMPLPQRHKEPAVAMPARNDRAMEQERGHTESSILHLKSMFPNYETAALKSILDCANGSREAAMGMLRDMNNSGSPQGGSQARKLEPGSHALRHSILDLNVLTEEPSSLDIGATMPSLSRSNSLDDDRSELPTPTTLVDHDPCSVGGSIGVHRSPSLDGSTEGVCDGRVGGFLLSISAEPSKVSVGWTPCQPIGQPQRVQ